MTAPSVPRMFHEDAFYEYFKPIPRLGTMRDIWGGHGLETYGEDLEIISRQDPAFLWTVVDGESADQWITAGFHYVNRVCYLVTEKPHNFALLEFRVRKDCHTLTPLGLKRQISTLKRELCRHRIFAGTGSAGQ